MGTRSKLAWWEDLNLDVWSTVLTWDHGNLPPSQSAPPNLKQLVQFEMGNLSILLLMLMVLGTICVSMGIELWKECYSTGQNLGNPCCCLGPLHLHIDDKAIITRFPTFCGD